MHRSALLVLLKDYRARFPQEQLACQRLIDFVRRQPECFERSLAEGHITGSCWLVDNQGERVLLTLHRKLNRWLQLGGHADGVSDVLLVALKEAREESGIKDIQVCSPMLFDIDIHKIPERGQEAAHYHYDCRFALQTSGNENYRISDESHDLKWITIDDLATVTTEESMLRMARKWMDTAGIQEH